MTGLTLMWRTSAVLQRVSEALIGSPPFPHNRFENSFQKAPCHILGKPTRRSFLQSLGKSCSVYAHSNKQERAVGNPILLFFHDGFTTLPQGLRLLIFYFGERRRRFKRKIADKVNIITTVFATNCQLIIDSKLPL